MIETESMDVVEAAFISTQISLILWKTIREKEDNISEKSKYILILQFILMRMSRM